MELNHLKYFYYTALEQSVSQAAKSLHVQQPVVSKMIKFLEEELGQDLFQKVGRKKVLTDYGQEVYRRCQVIFEEVESLKGLDSISKNNLSGLLQIGASDLIMNQYLSDTTIELHRTFPNLKINTLSGPATYLLGLIASRQIDVGIFFHMPTLDSNFEIFKRIPTRFKIVVSKKEFKNRLVLESFIGSREIDDTATTRFPALERLRRDRPKTRITFSSNNLSFHRQLVLNGLGVSILPDFLIKDDLKRKELIDLYPDEDFIFDLKAVRLKKATYSIFEQEIQELINRK